MTRDGPYGAIAEGTGVCCRGSDGTLRPDPVRGRVATPDARYRNDLGAVPATRPQPATPETEVTRPEKVRYGIIGTGMMGIEHILNLRLIDEAEVTAFADPVEQSRKWGRDTAGPDARVYEDYRELLADDGVDAVVICTPNFTHAAVLEDVFETQKHILCEKPLCTTLEDAEAVAKKAASHPGVFWTAMEYRYMPPVARLIEELRSGTIGKLRMLAIREHRFPFLPKVGDWNRFNRNTGGTLVEKCCHFFDLMRFITGSEAVRVFASGAQDVNHLTESYGGEQPDILDNAYTIVDFADGSRALLDLCMFAEGTQNMEEIAATGDTGKLECFLPDCELRIGQRYPRKIESHHVAIREDLEKAGAHHGSTYFQHLGFLRSIREGVPPEVSADDGLRAVEIGLAAQQSIAEGLPIELAHR